MSKYYKAEDVVNKIATQMRFEVVLDSDDAPTDIDAYIPGATAFLIDLPTIEVSEDAISREYLEEQYWQTLIPKEVINTDIELGINIGITKMHENIKNAPSVLPRRSCYRCGFREDCEDSTERKPKESEWIPCCERLPKDNGHYICSFTQPQRIDKIHIGLAYLENGRWVGYNAREINAWMPLPKPWKGADDE